MSSFSAFILNLSKSGNILFRSMPYENFLLSSASLSLVGDNSLLHELRVKAQISALKSVYGKSQPVIGGKLFSSFRTMFELA